MDAANDPNEEEPLVCRIVYSSLSSDLFSADDLIDLLERARAKNERLGVSGMLLYASPTFLQVLEGDTEVVASLYDVIEADDRHRDTRILLREEDVPRAFGDWTMGFVPARLAQLSEVEGLNDFLQAQRSHALIAGETEIRVGKILEQFKEGRWRREIEG